MPQWAINLLGIAILIAYWGFWVRIGAQAYGLTPGRRILVLILSWILAALPGFLLGLILGRSRAHRAAAAPAAGSARLPT